MVIGNEAVSPIPDTLHRVAICAVHAVQTVGTACIALLVCDACVARYHLGLAVGYALAFVQVEVLGLEALSAGGGRALTKLAEVLVTVATGQLVCCVIGDTELSVDTLADAVG